MQGRHSDSGDPAGLFVLFEPGARPESADIRAAADRAPGLAIGNEDSQRAEAMPLPPGNGVSDAMPAFELVVDGLTFDLCFTTQPHWGNAGACRYRYGLADDFRDAGDGAILVRPGSHLTGAERGLPVVRTQASIALSLIDACEGATALSWTPSSALMGADYFRIRAGEWLAGGAFPAPGFVAFQEAMGGAIQSCGLGYFTGQELRLERDSASEKEDSIRLAATLVDQLVRCGKIDSPGQIVPQGDTAIRVEPSRNGRFVRAWSQR